MKKEKKSLELTNVEFKFNSYYFDLVEDIRNEYVNIAIEEDLPINQSTIAKQQLSLMRNIYFYIIARSYNRLNHKTHNQKIFFGDFKAFCVEYFMSPQFYEKYIEEFFNSKFISNSSRKQKRYRRLQKKDNLGFKKLGQALIATRPIYKNLKYTFKDFRKDAVLFVAEKPLFVEEKQKHYDIGTITQEKIAASTGFTISRVSQILKDKFKLHQYIQLSEEEYKRLVWKNSESVKAGRGMIYFLTRVYLGKTYDVNTGEEIRIYKYLKYNGSKVYSQFFKRYRVELFYVDDDTNKVKSIVKKINTRTRRRKGNKEHQRIITHSDVNDPRSIISIEGVIDNSKWLDSEEYSSKNQVKEIIPEMSSDYALYTEKRKTYQITSTTSVCAHQKITMLLKLNHFAMQLTKQDLFKYNYYSNFVISKLNQRLFHLASLAEEKVDAKALLEITSSRREASKAVKYLRNLPDVVRSSVTLRQFALGTFNFGYKSDKNTLDHIDSLRKHNNPKELEFVACNINPTYLLAKSIYGGTPIWNELKWDLVNLIKSGVIQSSEIIRRLSASKYVELVHSFEIAKFKNLRDGFKWIREENQRRMIAFKDSLSMSQYQVQTI